MRAAAVLTATGAVAFVVSGVWFDIELAHIASEPSVPHPHFDGVLVGFLVPMTLLGISIAILLEGRARRRKSPRRGNG
jgi:hypothetical protein